MKWCLGTRSPVASRCPDEPSFVSLAVKPVGKPDALIGHVRFDERGWETGRRSGVSARAHPRLYNTNAPPDFHELFGYLWRHLRPCCSRKCGGGYYEPKRHL